MVEQSSIHCMLTRPFASVYCFLILASVATIDASRNDYEYKRRRFSEYEDRRILEFTKYKPYSFNPYFTRPPPVTSSADQKSPMLSSMTINSKSKSIKAVSKNANGVNSNLMALPMKKAVKAFRTITNILPAIYKNSGSC